MNGPLAPWQEAWDAYLGTLGLAAEGTLTSPEFLRLQRRTLDLLCGHRELVLKAMREWSDAGRPAKGRPARAAARKRGRR